MKKEGRRRIVTSATDPKGRAPKRWRTSTSANDVVIDLPWDVDDFDPDTHVAPPEDLEDEEPPQDDPG
jgi:hypothetical protein